MAASIEAASSFSAEEIRKISNSPEWIKLLHYERSFFGRFKSMVDGGKFFLHPQGKSDPYFEMQANIQAFNDSNKIVGYIKQHPECVFVERYRFLKKHKLIDGLNKRCDDFIDWKKGIDGSSITLVFSSSYPNNPSSLFGHTFLRINKKKHGKEKNDLLDYGASYAADVNDNNPFVYAYNGLFGGFRGYFNLAPYYMKVNEYISNESRDLYEYDLNIPPNRVEIIINHLWELYASAYFDYFFLDENCSFILGELLEVGMPDWRIATKTRFYYLPSEMMKNVYQTKGAVKQIYFRPSLKKQYLSYLKKLNDKQRTDLALLQEKDIVLRSYQDHKVLDTLISLLNFKKHQQKGKLSQKDASLYRAVLVTRAGLKVASSQRSNKILVQHGPEISHEPRKLSIGGGIIDGGGFSKLRYQMGYHDLLSSETGIGLPLRFDFLETEFRYRHDQRDLYLDHFKIIDIFSVHPYTSYDPQFSWRVNTGIAQIEDLPLAEEKRFEGAAAGGLCFDLFGSRQLFYLMLGVYSEVAKTYEKGHRIGPEIDISLTGRIFENYYYQLSGSLRADSKHTITDDYYATLFFNHSLSIKRNWELRFEHRYVTKFRSLKLNRYIHGIEIGHYF